MWGRRVGFRMEITCSYVERWLQRYNYNCHRNCGRKEFFFKLKPVREFYKIIYGWFSIRTIFVSQSYKEHINESHLVKWLFKLGWIDLNNSVKLNFVDITFTSILKKIIAQIINRCFSSTLQILEIRHILVFTIYAGTTFS